MKYFIFLNFVLHICFRDSKFLHFVPNCQIVSYWDLFRPISKKMFCYLMLFRVWWLFGQSSYPILSKYCIYKLHSTCQISIYLRGRSISALRRPYIFINKIKPLDLYCLGLVSSYGIKRINCVFFSTHMRSMYNLLYITEKKEGK